MKKYTLILLLLLLISSPLFSQVEDDCSVENIELEEIKPLVIDLLNHMNDIINSGVTTLNGYNPFELQVLAPYLEQNPTSITLTSDGHFHIDGCGFFYPIQTTDHIIDLAFDSTNSTGGSHYDVILSDGTGEWVQGGRITIKFCPCNDCYSFKLKKNEKYVVSGWVKEEHQEQVYQYTGASITLNFADANEDHIGTFNFFPSGNIIEGWQRVIGEFIVPDDTAYLFINLLNQNTDKVAYFDDIRIHPFNGNMKSFVYDPETQQLMAELDENNYATFYEYDKEGGLVRVKKETENGVHTIQETRSGNSKLTTNIAE